MDITLAADNSTTAARGLIVDIEGGADDIAFNNNIFAGSPVNNTSDTFTLLYSASSLFTKRVITGNTFTGGSSGIYFSGMSGDHSSGLVISGNNFSSIAYMALRASYVDAPVISMNQSAKDNYYNFYIESCNGALQISKNKLSGMSYGLFVTNCAGGNPPVGKRGLIANNSVIVTSGGNFGLYIVNSSNQDIYYNSVHVTSTDVNSARAFYAVNGSSINVVNNIFANTGGGMAYYVNNTNIISSSDYNDLFTTGNYLAFWGSNSVDLTAFQTASGKDAHSISVFPHFASDTDLTPASAWVNGKAQVISAVTDDINGTARNASKPDLGAFEFTPDAAVATPLAGSYSIGSGGDYNTIKSALDDLSFKGISAPVTFNIKSGNYNENASIIDIPGSSASDTVTIKSQSGNPNDVVWFHVASTNSDNYILQLRGTDHLRVMDVTMGADNSSTAARGLIVDIEGGADDIAFNNNIFAGSPVNNTSDTFTLLYSASSLFTKRVITGNTFAGGSSGIYFAGLSGDHSSGLVISGNNFSSIAYIALRASYVDAPVISMNQSTKDNYYNFYIESCNGALQISKNKLSGMSYGLFVTNCTGGNPPVGKRSLLANNFISVKSGGNFGLYLTNTSNLDVYYNSIYVSSSDVNSARAFYSVNGSSINVVNNIFANTGGGVAYYVNNTDAIGTSDYNDLYSAGTKLAHWGGDITDLAALQTASSKDAKSISENPQFVSSTNLHVRSSALNGKATPIAAIIDDIDGNPRDANTPDMGADEYTPGLNTPPVITSVADTVAYVGTVYSYKISADDINGDTLMFSKVSGPSWLTVDDTAGIIKGTPQQGDLGSSSVTVKVEDGKGGSDTQTFKIYVMAATGIVKISKDIPDHFNLYQNYPNPFNPSTRIRFALPEASNVKIEIYNAIGQRVAVLVNETRPAGYFEVNFDASKMASGLYIYRIQSNKFIQSKKMMLLK